MSQNGQTNFKNLAANAARFLKFVSPFWDIMCFKGLKFMNEDLLKKKFSGSK